MQTPAELAALHFASYNVPAQIFALPATHYLDSLQ